MKSYKARYVEILDSQGIDRVDLPHPLQSLIEKFENAHLALAEEENKKRQASLLEVLAQVDAVISGSLSRLYHPKASYSSSSKALEIEKAKMMAMKAKALKLKWRIDQA